MARSYQTVSVPTGSYENALSGSSSRTIAILARNREISLGGTSANDLFEDRYREYRRLRSEGGVTPEIRQGILSGELSQSSSPDLQTGESGYNYQQEYRPGERSPSGELLARGRKTMDMTKKRVGQLGMNPYGKSFRSAEWWDMMKEKYQDRYVQTPGVTPTKGKRFASSKGRYGGTLSSAIGGGETTSSAYKTHQGEGVEQMRRRAKERTATRKEARKEKKKLKAGGTSEKQREAKTPQRAGR